MNERDFFDGIKSDEDKAAEEMAGAEYFVHLKRQTAPEKVADFDPGAVLEKGARLGQAVSGIANLGPSAVEKLKEALKVFDSKEKKAVSLLEVAKDPASWPAAGIGAALLGGHTYIKSKPRKELGGQSEHEYAYNNAVREQRARGEEGAGLSRKVTNRTRELVAGLAKAFREHPAKATLLGMGTGALTGLSIARMMGAGGK